MHSRRRFLSAAALASLTIENLLAEVQSAAARVEGRPTADVASDRDFWFTIQQAFSGGRGITNLNNGGVSPSPRIVTEALTRYIWQQEDATAYTMWQILEPQSETIRAGLAKVFGCDKEEIAITRNASESLEILLMGIDLKSGDEIVTTTQDYPRMLTTLDQRERREGIKVKKIQIPLVPRSAGEIAEAFEKAVTPRTRLILMSHMVNITGQITPVRAVAEMARSRGIEVIVDGAHSFAQFAFNRDDLQCDYFGTSLHKWLYAPKGTGMLYVKRDRIEKVWPLMAAEKKQTGDIRKFEEIGTHSAAPRLAIGEALLFHHGIGPERKEARLRYLARYWTSQLRKEPRVRFHTPVDDDAQSCAVVTMEVEGIKPSDLAAHLMLRHKIFVTSIKHPEFRGIRVTPNVYTTLPELDRFVEVVARIAKNGIPPEPPEQE